MEIGRRVRHHASKTWRPVRWFRKHRSEFMAVAALALMLAPLLL